MFLFLAFVEGTDLLYQGMRLNRATGVSLSNGRGLAAPLVWKRATRHAVSTSRAGSWPSVGGPSFHNLPCLGTSWNLVLARLVPLTLSVYTECFFFCPVHTL